MHTHKSLARQCVITGAVVTALLLVACGGGGRNRQAILPLANGTSITQPPIPATPATLGDALAKLDALAMPEGVAPAVWNDLKAKLRDGLTERFGGKGAAKFVARAPTGAENRVWYIYTEEDEENNIHLKWRYQNVGDFNLNGKVEVSDVGFLAEEYGRHVSDYPEALRVDANGDGVINAGDITGLVMHFGNECTGYRVFGTNSYGERKVLDFIPLSDSVFINGNRAFDIPLSRWDADDPREFEVRAENGGVISGELSYKVVDYSTFTSDRAHYIGEAVDFSRYISGDEGSFVFSEFPEGISPRLSFTNDVEISPPAGSYEVVQISSLDGIYVYKYVTMLKIIGPTEIPAEVRSISLEGGPMIYWSRGDYSRINVEFHLYRDGVLLGRFNQETWYYYDFHAGNGLHLYRLETRYNNALIASPAEFEASGAEVNGEHLYIIAEPQEITVRVNLGIVCILANNTHPLWIVPGLRVWAQGTAETAVDLQASFLDSTLLAAPTLTKKISSAEWPVVMEAFAGMPSYPTLGHGMDAFAWYSAPWLASSPNVAAAPVGRTTIISSLFIDVTPPFAEEAKLIPGTNEEGAFNFYIDNQRNMYSFENVHSLDLRTFEVGSAVASTPVSGKLSLGETAFPGDFNGNGRVGNDDVTGFAMAFGSSDPQILQTADQNGDGFVSAIDLLYIVAYYGTYYP